MGINDQPGPHDHQLGAERKQSMPMKHPPLLLISITPSREKALQAKPKHITLVSFCQHLSTYQKFTQNDKLKQVELLEALLRYQQEGTTKVSKLEQRAKKMMQVSATLWIKAERERITPDTFQTPKSQ